MSIETSRPRWALAEPRRDLVARCTRRRFLAATALAGVATRLGQVARAGEARFPASTTVVVGSKAVRLALTGSALRTKYLLRVYTVASYAPEGVAVRSAEALATLDAPKQLLLVFERDVDGATMAGSFRDSIGRGHPAPAFAAELARLERYFLANSVKAGDRVALSYLPGAGLDVRRNAGAGVVIPGARFAQAVWATYLGPDPLDVALKAGLTSRLR